MKAVVAVSLLLLACSSASGPGPDPDPGQPDAGADPDADVISSTDEDLFHDILSGAVSADVGLVQIAQRGGFPIETRAGGFLFAALDDGSGPFSLAGDHDSWQGQPMTAEAGLHWIEITIDSPLDSLYKLVDGSGAFNADPLARRYGFDEFGEHSIVRSVTAHRERWPQVAASGAAMAIRTVRAWVPGDPTNIDRHIYVHDGQNLFDPGAPFGGWRIDETAPANVLVIGIDNTADRMNEYTPTTDSLGGGPIGGGGDAYADFIADDVIPMIELSHGAPTVRGVMGSSLGGLISLHQALRDPALFRFVASLSGTVGWGSMGANGETLIHRFDVAAKLPALLYLDSGGTDGGGCLDSDADGVNDDSADSDNYCVNRQLADLLDARGYDFDVDLVHFWEPGAGHNEAAWAARMPRVMSLFVGVP